MTSQERITAFLGLVRAGFSEAIFDYIASGLPTSGCPSGSEQVLHHISSSINDIEEEIHALRGAWCRFLREENPV